MSDNTERKPAELIAEWMNTNGITVESVFIPWSKSRNAPNPKAKDERGRKGWRSLNWEVTIKRNGRHVLTTEYAAGEAYCPANKNKALKKEHGGNTAEFQAAIRIECETGVEVRAMRYNGGSAGKWEAVNFGIGKPKAIKPNPVDAIWSFSMDSSVLDSGSFEDWAAEYGYDTDSREAEKNYRQCLEISLKLRAAVGDAGLQALRDAAQDY